MRRDVGVKCPAVLRLLGIVMAAAFQRFLFTILKWFKKVAVMLNSGFVRVKTTGCAVSAVVT